MQKRYLAAKPSCKKFVKPKLMYLKQIGHQKKKKKDCHSTRVIKHTGLLRENYFHTFERHRDLWREGKKRVHNAKEKISMGQRQLFHILESSLPPSISLFPVPHLHMIAQPISLPASSAISSSSTLCKVLLGNRSSICATCHLQS